MSQKSTWMRLRWACTHLRCSTGWTSHVLSYEVRTVWHPILTCIYTSTFTIDIKMEPKYIWKLLAQFSWSFGITRTYIVRVGVHVTLWWLTVNTMLDSTPDVLRLKSMKCVHAHTTIIYVCLWESFHWSSKIISRIAKDYWPKLLLMGSSLISPSATLPKRDNASRAQAERIWSLGRLWEDLGIPPCSSPFFCDRATKRLRSGRLFPAVYIKRCQSSPHNTWSVVKE